MPRDETYRRRALDLDRELREAKARISALECELESMREQLSAIESLLTDELRERFGSSEEQPKGSRIYSLLSVPRNMARVALAGEKQQG